MNNFNTIAPIYDLLATLVFVGKINKSQKAFLHQINNGDRVLILGGGAGTILKLLNRQDVDLNITYLDISYKMTSRAKSVVIKDGLKVDFMTADFFSTSFDLKYDVVICNYFLDLFNSFEIERLAQKIKALMKLRSRLLVTDFEILEDSNWQKYFYSVMLFFFRMVANVSVNKCPKHHELLIKEGFKVVGEVRFYKKFIVSRVYNLLPSNY